MMTLLVWLGAIVALPVLLAMEVLFVEVIAALLPARRTIAESRGRPRCAVLVPAHNEEAGIARTLAAIRSQLDGGDRILVVADNCSDCTAALAHSAGAEVVERTDPVRRGKGYALDHGVRTLEADPPEIVVIVDADCVIEAGSLDRLVRLAASIGRPAQASYGMEVLPGGSARSQLAAFLFAFKNGVRPRGLARLGLPCLLTGTGMAFPWELIRTAPLASGNIVEDMQLGIDLAIAGRAPIFCPEARVRSELPSTTSAAASQRTRWMHGHLMTLGTQAPRLLVAGIRQRRADLLGLALELSVPPLSLLMLLGAMATAALTLGWLCGGPGIPAVAVMVSDGFGIAAVLLAWVRFGREHLSVAGLVAVPGELARRLSILVRFLFRPQAAWIRTERRITR
jgi:cellulose synthase/poly-beta-1,6-N-acetylglucosamine synthase-like glycosyltransferase